MVVHGKAPHLPRDEQPKHHQIASTRAVKERNTDGVPCVNDMQRDIITDDTILQIFTFYAGHHRYPSIHPHTWFTLSVAVGISIISS